MVAAAMRRANRKDLERLKATLEQPATAPRGADELRSPAS